MTDEDPREPEYDPESSGLPDTVDPDSTAFDEDESVREASGDPVLWPDDTPVSLDVTSLDQQLSREVPDFGAEAPDQLLDDADEEEFPEGLRNTGFDGRADVVDDSEDEFEDSDTDELDDEDEGSDPYAEEESEDAGTYRGALQDDEAPDEFGEEDQVGRLADPDDGGSRGRNNRTLADDIGLGGGGASAEESAMHVIEDEEES